VSEHDLATLNELRVQPLRRKIHGNSYLPPKPCQTSSALLQSHTCIPVNPKPSVGVLYDKGRSEFRSGGWKWHGEESVCFPFASQRLCRFSEHRLRARKPNVRQRHCLCASRPQLRRLFCRPPPSWVLKLLRVGHMQFLDDPPPLCVTCALLRDLCPGLSFAHLNENEEEELC